jgi:histidine triad (HIT) family protein
MPTLFTRIVQGEIPCYKVAEDENYLAFLDINPLAKGHTLVIPRKEIDYIFDLDDTLFAGLNLFAKRIARAIDKSVTCKKVGIAVVGLEVPHAHIHLIPLNTIGELNFANPKLKFTPEEFRETAALIASHLRQ